LTPAASAEFACRGLTAAEAAERRKSDGPNTLPRPESRGFLRIVLEILREPMFALLLGAGVIYLALGDLREAIVLFLFATTSVSIAVVQDIRTERVLESLRDLTSPRALVIRDGAETRIAGSEVVRGDVVVLAEGDRVPADATVLAAHDLLADESLLTGEAVPVRKRPMPEAPPPPRPGGDDLPYVYSGSLIVRGHGRAVVTATGLRSEIGRIGVALTRIETEPPRLQSETRRLVRQFASVSLSLAALAALLYGLLRGSWTDALLSGIALGMSMLPEEFPLVLTVFMVMGAWRISRARVLTRRVAAIETLGAATVLCTDKTGTLTQNRMTIAELRTGSEAWHPGEPLSRAFAELLETGVLACAREPFDPMEKAFHTLADERLGGGGARPTGRPPQMGKRRGRGPPPPPPPRRNGNTGCAPICWRRRMSGRRRAASRWRRRKGRRRRSPRSAACRRSSASASSRWSAKWPAKACASSRSPARPCRLRRPGRRRRTGCPSRCSASSGSPIRCVRPSPRRSASAARPASGSS
jgi:Ca2+-transporting ATPase